jgi:hypothetical protein
MHHFREKSLCLPGSFLRRTLMKKYRGLACPCQFKSFGLLLQGFPRQGTVDKVCGIARVRQQK